MINRSFVTSAAVIACIVCSAVQLCAQVTITNPTPNTPASVSPQLPTPQPLRVAPSVTPQPVVQPAASAPAQAAQAAQAPQAVQVAEPMQKKQAAVANKPPRFLSQQLLPATTKAWISIPNAKDLLDRFDRTQFGELAKNKTLKPFADSLKSQIKTMIDEQNVRLNLDMDQLNGVNSGEMCFAGVLLEGGQHGVVFLMDVTNTRDKAVELSKRVSKKLIGRGATKKEGKIQGVPFTHLTLDKPKLFRTPRNNFQAIIDVKGDNKSSWMLVANNEVVFRDVLRRLSNPERIQAVQTLVAQPSFKEVMKQSKTDEFDSQLSWFVDPFGYHELAQRIRDEEARSRVPRDDFGKKFAEAGFDAFRGIGGQISIMTGRHEVLHRTFIYARGLKAGQAKVFNLLDFDTNKDLPHTLPRWVPNEASSVITGDWNMQKMLVALSHFYDSFTGKPGAFKRLLIDLKQDPKLRFDLKGVVDQLANRFVIVAATERPIGPKSERVVASARLKGEAKFVFDNISRANPDARIIKLGGIEVIEIDSTRETEDKYKIEEPDLDEYEDEYEDEEEEEEEEEEEKRFELFEKRYYVVLGNELIVANNKDYLKKILAQRRSKLETSADYVRIKKTLALLTDDTKVAWRQFGRLDRGLETNYEMLRRGEMASSQTMLARIVNQIFSKQAAENARVAGKEFDAEAPRKQELNGAMLPKDFSKSIAPYLGTTGSVLEVLDDGWRVTGVIMKRDNGPGAKETAKKKPMMEQPVQVAPGPSGSGTLQITPTPGKTVGPGETVSPGETVGKR